MPYKRKGIVKIEDVLPFLSRITGKYTRKYLGEEVKMGSHRYVVFKKKGTTCVCCGLEGQYFALERAKFGNTKKYHLNLYAINAEGNEVLMTKDHIIPRSKGGRDIISNYQTMCSKCNGKKADTLPGETPLKGEAKEGMSKEAKEERKREKRRIRRRAYKKRRRKRERAKKEVVS